MTDTDKRRKADRTGRDRMVVNLLWGWGGYLFVIVIGFIMPRLIDRHVGQFSLGIWDFCWSLVNYLSLSSLGVGSSVNRYVAKFRANDDVDSLCASVSSVLCVQLFIASFIIIGSIVLALILPRYFSNQLGDEMYSAQWVLATLGLSLAVEQALNAFRGVITGCHRWDIHNGLNVSSRIVGFGGMVVVLSLGMGLRALGAVYLGTVIITEIIRVVAAYKVCPELTINLSYVTWRQAKTMLLFGGKTVVATLSPIIVLQTTNILIISALGPPLLAVLARSFALVRHISTFMNKFSHIVTPTAGALQASGDGRELRLFLLDSTRYAVAAVLPLILMLVFFGDVLLTLLMGPQYAHVWVLPILAIGYFLPISQSPVLRILVGMNLHGKIGIISLAVTLTLFTMWAIVVHWIIGWNLINAALLLSVPIAVGNGIIVPLYACQYFKIPLLEYIRHVFLVPLLCSLALGIIFIVSRVTLPEKSFVMMGVAMVAGGLVTGGLYWRCLLSVDLRSKIARFVRKYMPFAMSIKND